MKVKENPTVCGLLANKPTKLSLAMHTAGYEALGLEFIYKTFDTEDTASALENMRQSGIRGLSLTIPHKENAMSLVDEISDAAQQIGAINTVINEDGKLFGENTDCYGIEQAFSEINVSVKDKKVLIIGAGGAARAACYVFSGSRITVANRNLERAEQLAKDFSVAAIALDEADAGSADVLINSTPIGSHLVEGGSEQLVSLAEKLPSESVVFDMVTKETELIKFSKKNELKVIEGVRMLLYQALEQFRLFTGEEPPIEAMEKALYEELGSA